MGKRSRYIPRPIQCGWCGLPFMTWEGLGIHEAECWRAKEHEALLEYEREMQAMGKDDE